MSLSPCHIAEPRVGIEQEMTSLLMRYSEPLSGVVLAFSNVRLAKPLGHIINEMPYIHCKVLADALVFQPREGMVLKGTVNKIGSNHIGMLFAGVFNGSVAASELPKGFVHNYAQDAWCVCMCVYLMCRWRRPSSVDAAICRCGTSVHRGSCADSRSVYVHLTAQARHQGQPRRCGRHGRSEGPPVRTCPCQCTCVHVRVDWSGSLVRTAC